MVITLFYYPDWVRILIFLSLDVTAKSKIVQVTLEEACFLTEKVQDA